MVDVALSNAPDPTEAQLSAMTVLVDEIFLNHSSHASSQDETRKTIIQDLDKLVKPVFSNVFAELFGSSGMDCALLTSDVNITINIEETEISQVRFITVICGRCIKLLSSSAVCRWMSYVMSLLLLT